MCLDNKIRLKIPNQKLCMLHGLLAWKLEINTTNLIRVEGLLSIKVKKGQNFNCDLT